MLSIIVILGKLSNHKLGNEPVNEKGGHSEVNLNVRLQCKAVPF